MHEVREHSKQLGQRNGVRTSERGLTLLAVEGTPGPHEPSIICKFLFWGGTLMLHATSSSFAVRSIFGSTPGTGVSAINAASAL